MSQAPLAVASLLRSLFSPASRLSIRLARLAALLAFALSLGLQSPARAQSGSLDPSFGNLSSGFFGASGSVYSIAVQPDGKTLVGGDMPTRIERYNLDGSFDTSFDPGSGANGTNHVVALQADGKIVIGGAFTAYGGTARNGVARLNADGSLDTTFDPGAGANGTVHGLVVLSSGQVVIGGTFTSYAGVARSRIARLDATGALDTSFAARSRELPRVAAQCDRQPALRRRGIQRAALVPRPSGAFDEQPVERAAVHDGAVMR